MRLKLFFIVAVFCVPSKELASQGMISILDKSTNPGEVLVEFDDRVVNTRGSYFIDEDWNTGEVYFRSGTIVKDFPVRYDLYNDLLEIQVEDQIKVLPIWKMDGFRYYDEESGIPINFVPCAKFKDKDGVPFTGICRVYAEGQTGLYSRYEYVLKDPDYVVALDMGTQEAEIYIKEKALLYTDDRMHEVPARKKRIYALFDEKEESVREFAHKEKLNPRKISDLKVIVDFINDQLVP